MLLSIFMQSRIKRLATVSITSLLVLASSFYLPFGFSAVNDGWEASFWLFISNTGGTVGVPLITIVFCTLVSLHYRGWKRKMRTIGLFLIAFSLVLGVFARLNEFFIKEQLQIERPNIKYLHQEQGFNSHAFYAFELKDDRRTFLQRFLHDRPEATTFNNRSLHPKVAQHWIHETGYSFPSGHSFNAFLMATLMAYIILFVYADFSRRRFFVLPFVWATLVALSRVLLGVHSPIDIVFGASFGVFIGFVLIATKYIDKLLVKKVG